MDAIAIEEITDDHLHTTISDGDLSPEELLHYLAPRVGGPIAITDHDTLGAHKRAAIGELATLLGIQLVPGIEMDATYGTIEMHILGFGMDVTDGPLNAHLGAVAAARLKRAREELAALNHLLGEGAFREEDVFKEGRETLMKPHFIKPLLEKGHFAEYREALAWYKHNVNVETTVAKPDAATALSLMGEAGATTVLAHPGYYVVDHGLDLDRCLAELRAMGLEGVEVDYPYHERSRKLFSPSEAREMVERIRAATVRAGLRQSRGTDCHSQSDLDDSYPGS